MSARAARGVSLIEALIALVVMAFGTLAALGVQSTLRSNADSARQRAEAVRLAQDAIELRRRFVKIDSGLGPRYADIADRAPLVIDAGNASYTRTETVVTTADPRLKALQVTVDWVDRAGAPQRVKLATAIAGVEPELAASLAVPMNLSLTRHPRARHVDIPLDAVDQGDGTSRFAPPNVGLLSWVFNHHSGLITSVCTGAVCVDARARLLAGFVRFATDPAQPTGTQSEAPPSPALPLTVALEQTAPATGRVTCHTRHSPMQVAYFCAVPVTAPAPRWSGRTSIGGPAWAVSIVDADATRYRVCRYTTQRAHSVAPTAMKNAEHPLDYVDVESALTQQNFLVIRAGNGVAAFDCPDDDPTTPFVRGTTWRHQPIA